jgi:hypothetical protein
VPNPVHHGPGDEGGHRLLETGSGGQSSQPVTQGERPAASIPRDQRPASKAVVQRECSSTLGNVRSMARYGRHGGPMDQEAAGNKTPAVVFAPGTTLRADRPLARRGVRAVAAGQPTHARAAELADAVRGTMCVLRAGMS